MHIQDLCSISAFKACHQGSYNSYWHVYLSVYNGTPVGEWVYYVNMLIRLQ